MRHHPNPGHRGSACSEAFTFEPLDAGGWCGTLRILPLAIAVLLLAWLPPKPARAALYEFTLKGEVLDSSMPNIAVADQILLRYVADSTDLNPDPTIGQYAAGGVTVTFPRQIFTEVAPPGGVALYLRSGNEQCRIGFYVRDDSNFHYSAEAGLAVAPGVFNSDALPLSLPFPLTDQMPFYLSPGIHARVTALIQSYSSVEVPEPAAIALLAAAGCCAANFRTGVRKQVHTGFAHARRRSAGGGLPRCQFELLDVRVHLAASLTLAGPQTLDPDPPVNASNEAVPGRGSCRQWSSTPGPAEVTC